MVLHLFPQFFADSKGNRERRPTTSATSAVVQIFLWALTTFSGNPRPLSSINFKSCMNNEHFKRPIFTDSAKILRINYNIR